MHSRKDKLAYLATRLAYPKENYNIVNKKHYVPSEGTRDWKMLELLNTSPQWVSNFLVINKDKTGREVLINVWVVFCKNKKNEKTGMYEGEIELPKKMLKNMMDDNSLYSNTLLPDSTEVGNSMSRLIVVVSHNNGEKYRFSKPIFVSDLVSVNEKFYIKDHRQNFVESIIKGKPVDSRPIKPGALLKRMKAKGTYEGISIYRATAKSIFIWWRFDGYSPVKWYPYVYDKDTCNSLLDKIKPAALDKTVGMYKSPTSMNKKSMDIISRENSTIHAMHAEYLNNKPEQHTKLKGMPLMKAQVEWIKRRYPDYVLFPNYHWAFASRTLYYEFKDKLN